MLINNHKTTILHLTPHLGGGVGSVLLNYVAFCQNDEKYSHSIATLDYANEKSVKSAKKIGFNLFSDMHKNTSELLKLIEESDIILTHFWNHPLLYDFLVRNELPPSRVIFWSHISGFNPPYVFTSKILDYPDKFVFTTPLSFDAKEVKAITDKNKLATVWSTGGVEHVKNVIPKPHKSFNIGYIGTVDYSKMHPDFIEICKKINIPDVKFIIIGGDREKEISKIADERFDFVGKVSDVKVYLEQFDVFGYPLNPEHYGTCEQVLQEAMAAGIVPVTLNNPVENYILQDGNLGIVAKSIDDYVFAIENLYKNPQLRIDMSQKIKEYAVKEFSLEKLNNDWNKIFVGVLNSPKKSRKWHINKQNPSHYDIFLESLGELSNEFVVQSEQDLKKLCKLGKKPNWQSRTKGTVHQYYDFFKNDKDLEKISKLMSSIQP